MTRRVRHIKLYFPRWLFPGNIGDSVMLSSLFKAVKERFSPCRLEIITDRVLIDTFHNDPYVDHFRPPNCIERHLPREWYRKLGGYKLSNKKRPAAPAAPAALSRLIQHRLCRIQNKRRSSWYVYPEWKERAFMYLRNEESLRECIESPWKNVVSINLAVQIGDTIVGFHDLRPRIYLTNEEIQKGISSIKKNAVGINVSKLRTDQRRVDNDGYRYKKESWSVFAKELKRRDPTITLYEIGQDAFEGIGDEFIPNRSIRETASMLRAMRLVVLSDGGLHNICNAADIPVLLFQAYEMNPPDLFKMGNAIFNETYHLECRKRCHVFSEIYQIPCAALSCRKECYNLDPMRLVDDCIAFLQNNANSINTSTK